MKRAGIIAAILVALLAGVAWTLWPQPELVDYTSPVLNHKGKNYRVRGKMPAGWEVSQMQMVGYKAGEGPEAPVPGISCKPKKRFQWLPKRIRDLIIGDREEPFNGVLVYPPVVPRVIWAKGEVTRLKSADPGRNAAVGMPGPEFWIVSYDNSNRTQFNRTYREVCSGVRVERMDP